MENVIGNLSGITLNLQTAFCTVIIFIFRILLLPTQEHGISHLLMSSLIYFTSVLKFSMYSSFVSLVKFHLRYLIILVPW